MINRVQSAIVEKCLALSQDDRALLVTTVPGGIIARALSEQNVVTVPVPPLAHPSDPLPDYVDDLLTKFNVLILNTNKSAINSPQVSFLTRERKIRVLSVPFSDDSLVIGALDCPEELIFPVEYSPFARLTGSALVEVSSATGTSLRFRVASTYVDKGRVYRAGDVSEAPFGRVRFEIIPDSVEGTFAFERTSFHDNPEPHPGLVTIQGGRILERLNGAAEAHGATVISGITLGTNRLAAANMKTFYCSLGASGYLTIVVGSGRKSLMLCGRIGQIKVDGMHVPIPEPFNVDRDSQAFPIEPMAVFTALFEQSNDAHYVLDFETQKFVDINNSFEALFGWSRDEAVQGKLRSVDLVAEASMETFRERRLRRESNPSEKYELLMKKRDGTTFPAEVSVRLVTIGGRKLVVGTVRDISSYKALLRENTEKMMQIVRNNQRIAIIKERLEMFHTLSQQMLNLRTEKELIEFAANFLIKNGFQKVNVYVYISNKLKQVFPKRKSNIPEEILSVANAVIPPIIMEDRMIHPMVVGGQPIGVLSMKFPSLDIQNLKDNQFGLRSYQNTIISFAHLFALAIENVRLYQRVLEQSIHDPLTGVYNRRYLDGKLKDEIKRAERYGRPLSIAIFDLDDFKKINDTMGHIQGDKVLQEFARFLVASFREVDTVVRYGGDEFVVVLPETSNDAAEIKSAKVVEELRSKRFTNIYDSSQAVTVLASVGVASLSDKLKTADSLIHGADELMMARKRAGKQTGKS